VGLSLNLENIMELGSPTFFEIVAQFYERLPYSFLTLIFLQLDVVEKEYMKFYVGKIMN